MAKCNDNVVLECPECELGPFTRNNYFTGKLLVERDFTDEQRYYIDKLRLHQQRLHGTGVVCGLQVVANDNVACRDRFVCIKPGLAKDCCGNDILVVRKECIDITQFPAWKELAKNPGERIPHMLQICIRYTECPTENIPVLYDECGCDQTACAPNRILESYDFDLIVDPELPPPYTCLPELKPGGTLPVANAYSVTLDPATQRIYVLNATSPGTLFQLDNAFTVLASHNLPGRGKSVAISDDGSRVYVASYDTTQSGTVLQALDASGLTLLGTSAAEPDDETPPVDLAALP